MAKEKLTYSVKEAAELLGVSAPFMYGNVIHADSFPLVQVGRKCLIPKIEFHEWLSREANKGRDEEYI